MTTETRDEGRVKESVRKAYSDIAAQFSQTLAPASCCPTTDVNTSCCSQAPTEQASLAQQLYSPEELASLPESVTGIALGCGNPGALAELQPGEVVLDIGSGGGIDCFLAAQRVGPTGKVIGLDMTPEMIKLARRNARQMGVTNVDFRYGEMEEIPLPDESVDVIISNCVINLSPDKDKVFAEAYRLLRPGGRIAISDIVLNGELPAFLKNSQEAWCGCIGGALDEEVYLDKMRQAGFVNVEVAGRVYVDVEGLAETPEATQFLSRLAEPMSVDQLKQQLRGKVASIKVKAYKPG